MSEEAPPGNLREIGGGVEYYLKIRAGTFCSACDGKIATVFFQFRLFKNEESRKLRVGSRKEKRRAEIQRRPQRPNLVRMLMPSLPLSSSFP